MGKLHSIQQWNLADVIVNCETVSEQLLLSIAVQSFLSLNQAKRIANAVQPEAGIELQSQQATYTQSSASSACHHLQRYS